MTPHPDAAPHLTVLARQLRRAARPFPCAHFGERLPLFVSDELAGYDVDALYAPEAAHLDLCDACMDEYVALSELLVAALKSPGADDGE